VRRIRATLVHIELASHGLQLLALSLQGRLIHSKLLGYLRRKERRREERMKDKEIRGN
jgi:hypothetical protein